MLIAKTNGTLHFGDRKEFSKVNSFCIVLLNYNISVKGVLMFIGPCIIVIVDE